ncbi:hypothetical protein FJZ17_02600 [Candidatus Pacearchaeota archaeon]|nr:hypothetical protein [Candidatus Pacearchaeota archaeon]
MAQKEIYATMTRYNYFLTLVVGIVILILSGVYINDPSNIGYGMLGFGLGIVLLLLDLKLNSITLKK